MSPPVDLPVLKDVTVADFSKPSASLAAQYVLQRPVVVRSTRLYSLWPLLPAVMHLRRLFVHAFSLATPY